MAAGELRAIFSANAWASSRESLRRVDNVAYHAQLQRTTGRHPLVAADQGHAHDSLEGHLAGERDQLVCSHLADRDVGVEEGGARGGEHYVCVRHEVQPSAGACSVDGGDDRLRHTVVPCRQSKLGASGSSRLFAQRFRISCELDHVETGLERGPRTGVHDHSDRRIGVELAPCLFELVEHGGVHGVADVGPVEDQPSHGAVALDQQRLVRHQLLGTSRHGRPSKRSGSLGRPSTRSPRMFLFTSVVPPSIVLARLRNMPRTS